MTIFDYFIVAIVTIIAVRGFCIEWIKMKNENVDEDNNQSYAKHYWIKNNNRKY